MQTGPWMLLSSAGWKVATGRREQVWLECHSRLAVITWSLWMSLGGNSGHLTEAHSNGHIWLGGDGLLQWQEDLDQNGVLWL